MCYSLKIPLLYLQSVIFVEISNYLQNFLSCLPGSATLMTKLSLRLITNSILVYFLLFLNNNQDFRENNEFLLYAWEGNFSSLHWIFIKLVPRWGELVLRLSVTNIVRNSHPPEAACIIESLACPSQTSATTKQAPTCSLIHKMLNTWCCFQPRRLFSPAQLIHI